MGLVKRERESPVNFGNFKGICVYKFSLELKNMKLSIIIVSSESSDFLKFMLKSFSKNIPVMPPKKKSLKWCTGEE